jgi:hypothetical protein
MTDESDDAPRKRYPPPMFAPAAEPAPIEPAEPVVVSGEISAGTPEPASPPPPPLAAPEAAAPAAPLLADEPLLPGSYSENDLRTAIGSPAMPEQIRPRRGRERDGDLDDDAPRSRRTMLVIGATLFLGLGIAALVILGWINAGHYAISCGTKEVTAERGRAFPPWGMSRLDGAGWKPIPIPASFQCVGLETADPTELGDAYRRMLVERAEAMLTAKEVTQAEDAAGILEQALLHARTDSEPHKTARQAIQRMLGDVGYWRASDALRKAAQSLADAAKQFETAAGQRPRYVSDANAWAMHVRRIIEDLRAGPAGARAQASPSAPGGPGSAPERPLAPAGAALPVEPPAGAGSDAGSAEPPPPAAPGAAVPGGGVLL